MPAPRRRRASIGLACVFALLAAVALSSCSPDPTLSPPPGSSAEATLGAGGDGEAPDRSTPELAVRAYLDLISKAYRAGDSELAASTMTPDELVRVDAYIEFNRQRNRRIEQQLVDFDKRSESVESTYALLTADERWRYGYIAVDSGQPTGDQNEAAYRTRYELVLDGGVWKVASVDVSATSPVP